MNNWLLTTANNINRFYQKNIFIFVENDLDKAKQGVFLVFKYFNTMKEVTTIIFDNFETEDVFGPIEILVRLKNYFNPEFYRIIRGRKYDRLFD